jgi:uncharacterized protein (TIGR02117 family)
MFQKIKIFKILIQSFLILFSLPLIYLLLALFFSVIATNPEKIDCPKTGSIYITSNGVHLDIVLPTDNMADTFLQKLLLPVDPLFISFGWGDKTFYLNAPEWKDLTFKLAFNALFLKGETSMHVSWFMAKNSEWKEIELCRCQIESVQSYIYNSFELNEYSGFQRIDVPGYFENDCFFNARGSYSLFRTCNNWSNSALKSAKIRTAVWSPFDLGILMHFN